ncbi:acyl-CoA thioester hydrolase [Kurthia sp. 3B1D]|uniref:Acyl-CoA thioester hydrolase n=1 Tax=Candidatus Kurthia intestinigallinarum TaxID=1562256 RepID=A0A433RY84_9BACL|nr:thioesterase family protein [Kurthia sp. 3B1D]RUS58209.1 acyl-CoA thioester hydrolase [Kurthia sp. 3B1D]
MLPAYIEDVQTWLADFYYFEDIKVRFCETDLFGHMNNTVPFIYFEQVRTAYMENSGLMAQELEPGVFGVPVMANLHCDYVQQAYYNDVLKVGVKIARIGRSSIDMHYVALKGQEIIFTGTSTVVQMNKNTGKSIAFNNEQLESLTGTVK